MMVRREKPADIPVIRTLVGDAFANHPHSDGREAAIVDALRSEGDLSLSMVAEVDGEIVGHIAFSQSVTSDGERGWVALGPVAVRPDRQGTGIGRALIERGIAMCYGLGAKGVVVLGDPALYRRFGFKPDTPLCIDGELDSYFQVLPLSTPAPEATLDFAPAFGPSPASS